MLYAGQRPIRKAGWVGCSNESPATASFIYASFWTIEEHFFRMMFNACSVSFLQQITRDAEVLTNAAPALVCGNETEI